jgi:hypothetical protein
MHTEAALVSLRAASCWYTLLPMSEQQRKVLGSVYRVTAEFLAQRHLAEEVLSKVSPETRKIIAKPPFGFSWQSGGPLEEIERILFDLRGGRDLCADLGLAASLNLCGSLIQGVVRMSFALFGQTPASLFSNADRFFQMVTTGLGFRYEATTDKTGVVWAEIAGGEVHSSLFDQIRGNLSGAYPLCSVRGEVGPPEVQHHDAERALVKYAVRWD